MATLLADHAGLMDHRARVCCSPARTQADPSDWESAATGLEKAWRDAGLEPLGSHEARHTFASLMIAAGVNAKALSTYMGHANIAITLTATAI